MSAPAQPNGGSFDPGAAPTGRRWFDAMSSGARRPAYVDDEPAFATVTTSSAAP
jgi:hypothetical protein